MRLQTVVHVDVFEDIIVNVFEDVVVVVAALEKSIVVAVASEAAVVVVHVFEDSGVVVDGKGCESVTGGEPPRLDLWAPHSHSFWLLINIAFKVCGLLTDLRSASSRASPRSSALPCTLSSSARYCRRKWSPKLRPWLLEDRPL